MAAQHITVHLVTVGQPRCKTGAAVPRPLPALPEGQLGGQAASRDVPASGPKVGPMGWWSRRRGKSGGRVAARTDGPGMSIDEKAVRSHLRGFAATRRGAEAYVEPPTSVTPTTAPLPAH